MIFNVSYENDAREKLLDYLRDKKFERVLDIGGSMAPWAKEFVTHYLDILDIHIHLKNTGAYDDNVAKSKMFVGDINDDYGWREVFGEPIFDFVICSQTIEDIRNPSYVLKSLPLVAKEGYISVPHKCRELSYVENHAPQDQEARGLIKPYVGYCHHRWIFTVIDDHSVLKLRLFPKLEFISCIAEIQTKLRDYPIMNELTFWWKDDLPFEIINNDFLGPTPQDLFKIYSDKIFEGA